MLIADFLGWPQILALAVLLQRGLEELHSARNTARLMQQGAQETGSDFYPVVAVSHLAWIAAIALLVPPEAAVNWWILLVYVALQAARYWIIGSLGRYWTHRIITLETAPIITRGPYRLVRHPNYVVTVMETFLLPLVFGAWQLSVIMSAIWIAVIVYKVRLEDQALASRRAADGTAPGEMR